MPAITLTFGFEGDVPRQVQINQLYIAAAWVVALIGLLPLGVVLYVAGVEHSSSGNGWLMLIAVISAFVTWCWLSQGENKRRTGETRYRNAVNEWDTFYGPKLLMATSVLALFGIGMLAFEYRAQVPDERLRVMYSDEVLLPGQSVPTDRFAVSSVLIYDRFKEASYSFFIAGRDPTMAPIRFHLVARGVFNPSGELGALVNANPQMADVDGNDTAYTATARDKYFVRALAQDIMGPIRQVILEAEQGRIQQTEAATLLRLRELLRNQAPPPWLSSYMVTSFGIDGFEQS